MSRPLENVLLLESKMADIVLRDIELTTIIIMFNISIAQINMCIISNALYNTGLHWWEASALTLRQPCFPKAIQFKMAAPRKIKTENSR